MNRLLLLAALCSSPVLATTSELPAAGGGSLPDPVTVAHGGTGATTTTGARSGIGAAASGSNADITALTGVTTPLPLTEGGTGATTASGARSSISAASNGANGDITSLTGITTALPISEGGTAATSAGAALTSLGAAPSSRTISTTAPITGGGDLSANRTIAIPAATSSVDGYLAHADWGTFNSKAASGANADITSLGAIGQTGIQFDDLATGHVILAAPATVSPSFTWRLPTAPNSTIGATVVDDGTGQLEFGPAVTGFVTPNDLNTKSQGWIGSKPSAVAICTAADGNQDPVGGGSPTCDGVTPSGGAILLTAQTSAAQNGLWDVNAFGAWTYDPTWFDQSGGCSGSDGEIFTVKGGGTLYGYTTWMAKCVAGNATFVQLPVSTRNGACETASTLVSTTPVTLTCNGVPATSAVAVWCSGEGTAQTPTADGLYCKANGTANTILCNTLGVNNVSMKYACMWMQP